MPRQSAPIRYQGPKIILGKVWNGRKCFDAVTGFLTYADFLGPNDFGDLVDVRGNGVDRDEGFPAVSGPNSGGVGNDF